MIKVNNEDTEMTSNIKCSTPFSSISVLTLTEQLFAGKDAHNRIQ